MNKHAPKLTDEQKEKLLVLLSAGYTGRFLDDLIEQASIPHLDRTTLSWYRERYGTRIDELKKIRYSEALETGLAKREERVARLKLHADRLDKMMAKYEGFKGWENIEKAWRATLVQIAEETGDQTGAGKISSVLIKFANKRKVADEPG